MQEYLSNSLIYLPINCLKKEYIKPTKKAPKNGGLYLNLKNKRYAI